MYFCKNCGEAYMTDEAVMCVKCGVAKGKGDGYCHSCGKPVAEDAEVCMNCGVPHKRKAPANAKSKVAAGLLAIFLGAYGVHNFYLGYTKKAVTQLVITLVGYPMICAFGLGVFMILGVSIWGLIEGIMIFAGNINADANGVPLTD